MCIWFATHPRQAAGSLLVLGAGANLAFGLVLSACEVWNAAITGPFVIVQLRAVFTGLAHEHILDAIDAANKATPQAYKQMKLNPKPSGHPREYCT